MCADIHDGQEQNRSRKGPNTDERDQLSPDQSHPACNARPVHTDVPEADSMQRSKTAGHSMSWSARSRKDSEIVSPSALAVLRLITSANLVGCWTGRLEGLAPF